MTTAPRRRLFLGLFALGGAYLAVKYGVSAARRFFAPDLAFEPVADPAGFRRIAGGQSSRGIDPLAGIGAADGGRDQLEPHVKDNLCGVLFNGADIGDGVVPIAFFSDYKCPYCRVLSETLNRMEKRSGGAVRIVDHELPIFGAYSVLAARAALAAREQGAYREFHDRLIATPFQTTQEYIEGLAGETGLDVRRLARDMQSARTERQLRESRAAADLFGFIGTPALVVGRTVVQGAIDDVTLEALIDRERADGTLPFCG